MENSRITAMNSFELPGGTVSEDDMPGIQARIEQVLAHLKESAAPAGSRADYPAIRSNLLAFQAWLRAQECVASASSSYDIENTNRYDDGIFITHPGQLPFDIVFKMEGGTEQAWGLLLFVTTYDLFDFGSLVKNNAKEAVFIPQKWPEDAPAFWESRS
jgi:hypothetical protein